MICTRPVPGVWWRFTTVRKAGCKVFSIAFYPQTITCPNPTIETLEKCQICSKLTIKTSKRRHWRRFGVFIVNFEHISQLFLVLLLQTLMPQKILLRPVIGLCKIFEGFVRRHENISEPDTQLEISLRKICQDTVSLWHVFLRIEDSVLIRENTGQKNPYSGIFYAAYFLRV